MTGVQQWRQQSLHAGVQQWRQQSLHAGVQQWRQQSLHDRGSAMAAAESGFSNGGSRVCMQGFIQEFWVRMGAH